MKLLTLIFILFISSPSYSCFVHEAIFYGLGISDTETAVEEIKKERYESATGAGPKSFSQFKNFMSKLEHWKEGKQETIE